MSRKNKRKKFKKKGLQSTLRKIFTKQPDQKYTAKDICRILQTSDKNMHKLVLSILNDLKNEGFLNEFQRGAFILNENYQTQFTGTVDATSRGAAYIIVPELNQDIYINPENLSNALHKDTVEVEIIRRSRKKIFGKITKIVERKTTQFIGVIETHKKYAFLLVDNSRINIDLYIPLNKLNGAQSGEKVIGKITSWPKGVDNPFGEVSKVIGEPGDNDTEMLSILLKNDFEIEFPKEVSKEAKNIGIDLDPKEIKTRKDLRNKLTFTIDPFDAKDFDDALSYEVLKNGNIEVGIHIADVSHYVQPKTAMDEEAYKRGNSVYLEDRVIPMLPEQLSNIACSLRPNEDKYAFSAVFEVNSEGKVLNEWFGKTVIHSNHRYNYDEAQAVIEGKDDKLKDAILALDKIAKTLRKKRLKKGALAITSEEVSFIIDEEGNPTGVKQQIQKDANKLIEEFMLLANKRVALFVGKLPNKKGSNTQFIYRCHDKPDIEKLNTFSTFIDKFGYNLDIENIDNAAKKINALLEKIKDTPEYGIIQSMAIRSMSKAEYQTNNIGHYGLAFEYYTHFTSPIRRYADLVVHRILLDKINKKNINYGNKLNEISKYISSQERKAIDSERESNKFFQAKYMNDKIHDTFEGTVSGLADFGMFVRINENYCEGMIPIHSLPDDTYFFDSEKFQIIGRHSGFKYNFGDQVKVQVKDVNLFKKQIDLKILP